MALPDYFKIEQGTAIVWGQTGASGVTLALTLVALAAAAGRMGAVADLGAQWDEEYLVTMVIETGTAPTANTAVRLYLPCAHDTSFYPGTVTGSDAAFTVANAPQLGDPALVFYARATGNVAQIQAPVIWRPAGRYVVPVVINDMNQAIRNETTDTDNDSRVILVPRRLLVQDAA